MIKKPKDSDTSASEPIIGEFTDIMRKHNFRYVTRYYSEMAFGNLLVEFSSPTICCRLIRDRSEWFIEVKSKSTYDWIFLGYIREILTGRSIDRYWEIEEQLQ